MDDFRFILLLSGVVMVLAVYTWTRYQRRPRKRTAARTPSIGGQQPSEPDAADIEQELANMGRLMAEPDSVVEPAEPVDMRAAEPAPESPAPLETVQRATPIVEKQLLVISVVAGADRSFDGAALGAAFEHNGLEFHRQGIFQRLVDCDERRRPVFGVANIVQPGVFESAKLQGFSTPGITLYLQLPAPIDSLAAFDDFVTSAERLAVELGGELRDEQQEFLTHQDLMQIRKGISKAGVRATP